MKILCHRGVWNTSAEKNSAAALVFALNQGLGIETDIRDCAGELVISHDPPLAGHLYHVESLLHAYQQSGHSPMLALNIKADGLASRLCDLLARYNIDNYFVFDMSVPDLLDYKKTAMSFAVRLSEYEAQSPLFEHAEFVWLDAFENEWYSTSEIERLLACGKKIAVVSPELHRREHRALWTALKQYETDERLFLCTDFVQEARGFFDVRQD